MDHEPYVDRICGPGVDPVFDKLINSLGSLGKHKPKPVIDSVMYWRKMKSEQANAARQEYEEVDVRRYRVVVVLTWRESSTWRGRINLPLLQCREHWQDATPSLLSRGAENRGIRRMQ